MTDRCQTGGPLADIPFSKTRCGVDFYINTGEAREIRGVLTEHRVYRTDFFQLFFFRRAGGFLLIDFRRIDLHDGMVLILSPHQQLEWHVDEEQLEYDFLIFREDFMRTFLADKFFVYRLLYCYQTDNPPTLPADDTQLAAYGRLLREIKRELGRPLADSYNLIVAVLYYLLLTLNRRYAGVYGLPVDAPKNNHAFRFKELLEHHIRRMQRVGEYAALLRISRITLNNAVQAQFGVTAGHLLRQRLVEELKNEVLFSDRSVSQIAYDFNFSDPSHLMRFFKRQTGRTITRYKEDYAHGIYE